MLSFKIAKRNAYCPDVIEGAIAYDNGLRLCDDEAQLWDSWDRIRQKSSDDIVALFIDELDALFEVHTIKEILDLNRFSGIVTFGVHDANNAASQPVGTSHFDIVANELEVPLLQLKRPREFHEQSTWGEWVFNNPLKNLYEQHIAIVLDENNATITHTR